MRRRLGRCGSARPRSRRAADPHIRCGPPRPAPDPRRGRATGGRRPRPGNARIRRRRHPHSRSAGSPGEHSGEGRHRIVRSSGSATRPRPRSVRPRRVREPATGATEPETPRHSAVHARAPQPTPDCGGCRRDRVPSRLPSGMRSRSPSTWRPSSQRHQYVSPLCELNAPGAISRNGVASGAGRKVKSVIGAARPSVVGCR